MNLVVTTVVFVEGVIFQLSLMIHFLPNRAGHITCYTMVYIRTPGQLIYSGHFIFCQSHNLQKFKTPVRWPWIIFSQAF